MTNPSDHQDPAAHQPRGPSWRRSPPIKWMVAVTVLLGVGGLAAGCGGSNNPGTAGSGSAFSSGLAYTNCMRAHGAPDFPDPTLNPSGGVVFKTNGNNRPMLQAAAQACQSQRPGGNKSPAVSAQQLAAGVKWAQCIRTHGVPTFPDPNAQGAFDSGVFDPTSSAFQAASQDCRSLQPTGSVAAVPGVPG
jgi:hypothetical protein